MPNHTTYGSASSRGYGQWYPQQGYPNWFQKFGYGSQQTIAIDTDGNIYVGGWANNNSTSSPTYYALITKFTNTGIVIWQKYISDGTEISSLKLDSSNNIYIAGGYFTSSLDNGGFVSKLDNNGNIIWIRNLSNGSYQRSTQLYSLQLDTSGNVIVAGFGFNTGYSNFVIKYNSSGAVQWQKQTTSAVDFRIISLVTDSSDNIYIGAVQSKIIKLDTNGTILWKKSLGSIVSIDSMAIDNLGNLWIAGQQSGITQYWINFSQLDSSGNFLRGYRTTVYSNFSNAYSMYIYNNYLYIGGYIGSSPYVAIIIKFNLTTLSIVYMRYIADPTTHTYNNTIVTGIVADADNYYISGYMPPKTSITISAAMTANLPADGTKTGAYVLDGSSITYGNVSPATISSSGNFTSNLTNTMVNITMDTASFLTIQTLSLTSYLLGI